MASDGEINLSYVPTAEMLADCFTNQLPKPAVLKQSAAMRMIRIGFGNDLRIGIGNGLGNGHGNGIGTRNANGNAVGKQIDSLGTFVSRRSILYDWLLFSFVYCFLF
jgi:hypothetical protein